MHAKQVGENFRAAYAKMVRDYATSEDAKPQDVLDCVGLECGVFAGHQAVQEVGRERRKRKKKSKPVPNTALASGLVDLVKQAEDVGTGRKAINSAIAAFLYEMCIQGIIGTEVLEEAKQHCGKARVLDANGAAQAQLPTIDCGTF